MREHWKEKIKTKWVRGKWISSLLNACPQLTFWATASDGHDERGRSMARTQFLESNNQAESCTVESHVPVMITQVQDELEYTRSEIKKGHG